MSPDILQAHIARTLTGRPPMSAVELALKVGVTPGDIQRHHEGHPGAWWSVEKISSADGFRYRLREMMKIDRPVMTRDFAERHGV
jgi:phosphate starvation-inducible protein PhoH